MEFKKNQEDFVSLLYSHYRKIYTYIYALTSNREDAEDVTQEVFIYIYRNIHKYTPNTNFLAWAKKIAFHKTLDYRRSRKLKMAFAPETMQLVSKHIDKNRDVIEERLAVLRTCIEELNEDDKHLIAIRYKKEGTMEELCNIYRVSLATIYRRIERIQLLLMRCIRVKLVK